MKLYYQNIPDPSPSEVKKYLEVWENDENYQEPEKALRKLFRETYPQNKNIEQVLIKVYALNDAYNVNVLSPHTVPLARHIVWSDIDKELASGEVGVVKRLEQVPKCLDYYSFATKYCSFHNPEVFPIYDSRVADMLGHFKKKDGFAEFTQRDLRNYETFHRVIFQFRKYYSLEFFSIRDIDKYLWLLWLVKKG